MSSTLAVAVALAMSAVAPTPPPYAASAIVVERVSDLVFAPGQPAQIKFKLTMPAEPGTGPVGFSLPLTGLPSGTPVMRNGPFDDCHVDVVARRAWCPDVAIFWPSQPTSAAPVGVGWVSLTVNMVKDLNWLAVPVTVSTPAGSAESVHDLASAEPPAQPQPTTIDVDKHWEAELDDRWTHGWPLRFGAHVRGVSRPVPLIVEQKPAGATAWKTVATLTTNARGGAEFVTRPHITSSYRFSFPGDADHQAASTTVAGPGVQAGTHSFTGPSTGRKGKKLTFTVVVDPAPRKVTLQWDDDPGPGWVNQDTKVAGADGKVTLSFTPKKTGKLRLQVILGGDARAVWSWSAPKFVTVSR